MSHSLNKCFLGFPYKESSIFDFDNESPYEQELSPELKSSEEVRDILEIEAFSSPNSKFLIDRDSKLGEYSSLFSDRIDFFSFLNEEDSFVLDSHEGKKRKMPVEEKQLPVKYARHEASGKEKVKEKTVSNENRMNDIQRETLPGQILSFKEIQKAVKKISCENPFLDIAAIQKELKKKDIDIEINRLQSIFDSCWPKNAVVQEQIKQIVFQNPLLGATEIGKKLKREVKEELSTDKIQKILLRCGLASTQERVQAFSKYVNSDYKDPKLKLTKMQKKALKCDSQKVPVILEDIALQNSSAFVQNSVDDSMGSQSELESKSSQRDLSTSSLAQSRESENSVGESSLTNIPSIFLHSFIERPFQNSDSTKKSKSNQ